MMCLEQREITLCFVTILTRITKFLQGSMHTNTLEWIIFYATLLKIYHWCYNF